jgi:hypothetical protein
VIYLGADYTPTVTPGPTPDPAAPGADSSATQDPAAPDPAQSVAPPPAIAANNGTTCVN